MFDFAYVGCRTSRMRGARGQGIKVFTRHSSGDWQLIQTLPSAQDNPSWLAFNAARTCLYVIHGDGNLVSLYRRDGQSGLLHWVADQTTGPANPHPQLDPLRRNNPVHAVITPDEGYLLIANHEGGNIACLRIEPDDTLSPPLSLTPIVGLANRPGEPVNLSRPHEMIFAPDNRHFALPVQGRKAGQGIDMVQIYRYESGVLQQTDQSELENSSWPRHVDFHPSGRWLYCLTELGNTLTVFDYATDSGKITRTQTLSSLPDSWQARSDASEIEVHPNGKVLYAANRGHDSIGIFAINPHDGTLTAKAWVPCGGKTPRFTTLSPNGRYFYSANEDADTLCEFRVDTDSGMLESTGVCIPAESPTCICFA